MARTYNGTSHPAVSITSCPFCHSAQGTPCKVWDHFRYGPMHKRNRRYTETHSARIKKARKAT